MARDANDESSQTPTLPTRRQVVGGVAAGSVAGLASSAVAQTVSERSAQLQGATNMNPEDKMPEFAKPPFKSQSQPWPGLASKMEPRPDHGETTYKGTGRLVGRKALITGGDSGMGRGAAIAFAREGADVVINYLPEEEADAKEVLELIAETGRIGVGIPGDLRSEEFCKSLVAQAVKALGGLDILVSNAAKQAATQSIADISNEQFDRTMKTNIYAMFWLTKAALPQMKPGSTIIVTTSEQAFDPSEDLVDYAMTKAAGMSFVKSMGKQLAKKGVRINAPCQGLSFTSLY